MAKYYQEKRTCATTYRRITVRGGGSIEIKTNLIDTNGTAIEDWQLCKKEAVDDFALDVMNGIQSELRNVEDHLILTAKDGVIQAVIDGYGRPIPYKVAWATARRENPEAKPDWTFIRVQQDRTDVIDWNGTVGYRAFYSLYRPDAKSPRLKIPFIE